MRQRFQQLVALCFLPMLPACAPFSSENSYLGLEARSDHHVQSYFLPKTILTATVTVSGKSKNLTTGWEKVVDRRRSFKVNYQNSIVHEDDLHIETDAKGLLKEVKANSDDKTAQIVEAAAKIFMSTISGQPSDVRTLGTAALAETQLLVVQFDPFDAGDFIAQNAILHRQGFCMAVFDRNDRPLAGSCTGNGTFIEGGDPNSDAVALRGYNGSGFFYRRPVEHRVVIFRQSAKSWRPIWSGWHQFEQQGDLNEVRVDRGSFIKLEAKLTFSEGNLTKYEVKKPSELLGFMKIPATIVNTIVQIPGLQVTAAENANSLKERELAAREKELQLRQRELQLIPTGTAPDGRLIYTVPGVVPRIAQASNGVAELAAEKRRFMDLCADQQGLNTQDCEAAWTRRGI